MYERGDYVGLFGFLSSVEWSLLNEISDVDEQVTWFTNALLNGMRWYMPLHTPASSKCPLWSSGELRTTLNLKGRAHHKTKRFGFDKGQMTIAACVPIGKAFTNGTMTPILRPSTRAPRIVLPSSGDTFASVPINLMNVFIYLTLTGIKFEMWLTVLLKTFPQCTNLYVVIRYAFQVLHLIMFFSRGVDKSLSYSSETIFVPWS